MKLLITLLVSVVIGLSSVTPTKAQTTCFPDSIVEKIVDELIIKDGLMFKLDVMDSTLRVYEQMSNNQAEEITVLKLTNGQWVSVYARLEELQMMTVEERDREARKAQRNFWIALGGWVAFAITVFITGR